jgi:hypothetical protein
MITEEKIKELQKLLRSGVPGGEVKEELIKQGYTNEDIDKVFVPHHYDMRSWYLFFAIILLLAGICLIITRENVLALILSALLFFVYYREIERLKKTKKPD